MSYFRIKFGVHERMASIKRKTKIQRNNETTQTWTPHFAHSQFCHYNFTLWTCARWWFCFFYLSPLCQTYRLKIRYGIASGRIDFDCPIRNQGKIARKMQIQMIECCTKETATDVLSHRNCGNRMSFTKSNFFFCSSFWTMKCRYLCILWLAGKLIFQGSSDKHVCNHIFGAFNQEEVFWASHLVTASGKF